MAVSSRKKKTIKRAKTPAKARKKNPTKAKSKAKTPQKVKLHAKAKSSVVPKPLPDDIGGLIQMLEKSWPSRKTSEISRIFSKIRKHVTSAEEQTLELIDSEEGERPARRGPPAPRQFNLLDLLRRTMTAHDLLFLRRQIMYHIAASSALPGIFADMDKVQASIASLLEYMAMHAPRGSRINVQLSEINLRSGSGIEISFSGIDQSLKEVDKNSFIQRMYQSESEDGMVLVNCRELVSSQGGQMWADLPKPQHPSYHMILPSTESAAEVSSKPNLMYKYDISITNYANVRKRFGIRKSLSLVGQVEMYVRALVRHPIDIVTAVREKGIITTIYESPKGSAQSVASRISQRLGSEEFRIGKRAVDLLFRYQLSQLPSSGAQNAQANKGSMLS